MRCQLDLLGDLWGPVPWKQIGEVFFAQFIFRHSAKDIFQPRSFVDVMGLAGGKKGVDYCSPLRSIIISSEQVVLATYSQWTDTVFNHVVVYLVASVGCIKS